MTVPSAVSAKSAGIPVNVVDRPELCDFLRPALVNRAPLAVAISTEGAAPVLARHVRARIEALLAPGIGDLAGLAERLRERVAARIKGVEARRRFWAISSPDRPPPRCWRASSMSGEADADSAIERCDRGAGSWAMSALSVPVRAPRTC